MFGDKGKENAAEKEVATKEKAAQKIKGKTAKKTKKVPVFSITTGDPYIDGVVRHINNAKEKSKIDVNARPLVIPANDTAALSALGNYVLRAAGGGDTKRADIAKEAIKTFKAFAEK